MWLVGSFWMCTFFLMILLAFFFLLTNYSLPSQAPIHHLAFAWSRYNHTNKLTINIKLVRSLQPGILSLMSYSLLWFVKMNTELLWGVFTTQCFDTRVQCLHHGWFKVTSQLLMYSRGDVIYQQGRDTCTLVVNNYRHHYTEQDDSY